MNETQDSLGLKIPNSQQNPRRQLLGKKNWSKYFILVLEKEKQILSKASGWGWYILNIERLLCIIYKFEKFNEMGDWVQSQKGRMISVHFQSKPFNIIVMQVDGPTNNAKEAEVEWLYDDLQDLLELTPKKDILFIIGDWNAKEGSQEISGVTGKVGLGVQNEQGKG